MMFLCLLFSEEKSFTTEFFCLADCSNNFGAVIAGFNGNKEFAKSTASKFLTHLGLENRPIHCDRLQAPNLQATRNIVSSIAWSIYLAVF